MPSTNTFSCYSLTKFFYFTLSKFINSRFFIFILRGYCFTITPFNKFIRIFRILI